MGPAYSGILLHTLSYSGTFWHTLAYSGILWHTLVYSGILWHTIAYSCILWHTLAYAGILWHTLAIPYICHFFYTDRIFENQILHPKKRLKSPKTLKMSLKKSYICIFVTHSGKIYT